MLRLCRCYGRSTVVSNVDGVGVVLNIDGGNVQELDYVEVRTTERWINTQGEMVRWQGLYKVCQRLSGKCRDSTKYAQEWMYKGCCRVSRTRSFIRFSELESLSLDMIRWLVT
jgi:hypothetical protein